VRRLRRWGGNDQDSDRWVCPARMPSAQRKAPLPTSVASLTPSRRVQPSGQPGSERVVRCRPEQPPIASRAGHQDRAGSWCPDREPARRTVTGVKQSRKGPEMSYPSPPRPPPSLSARRTWSPTAGSVRSAVPRNRGHRRDLLPVQPRDNPVRPVHRARRCHRVVFYTPGIVQTLATGIANALGVH